MWVLNNNKKAAAAAGSTTAEPETTERPAAAGWKRRTPGADTTTLWGAVIIRYIVNKNWIKYLWNLHKHLGKSSWTRICSNAASPRGSDDDSGTRICIRAAWRQSTKQARSANQHRRTRHLCAMVRWLPTATVLSLLWFYIFPRGVLSFGT
jgi:hypothetical protein